MPVVNDSEAATTELCKLQKKQRCCIQLQVSPTVIRNHRVTTAAVVFGVQGIQGIQAALEALDLLRLAHHGVQQSTH